MKKQIFFLIIGLLISLPLSFAVTVISISPVGFASNDPQLDGQAWLVSFTLKGDQYLTGVIKKESMTLADGRRPENDLTISAQGVKNSCNYDIIRNYDDNIFQYSYYKSTVYKTSMADFTSQCRAKSNYNFVFGIPYLFTADMYCIQKDIIGVPATIKTPIESFEAKLSVSAKGQTSTGTINSLSSTSINIPPVAYAQWVGSFSSGEICPNIAADGYMGINDKTGNWILLRQSIYGDYKSSLNNFEVAEKQLADKNYNSGLSSIDQYLVNNYINQINIVNQKAANTQTSFGYETPSGKDAVVSGTQSSGKIFIDLDRFLITPVITMKVDADWLGIFMPVGKPQINSLSSIPFTEGKNGNIEATIQNIGTIASSFTVDTSCTSPFSLSTTSRTTPLLQPNQQSVVNIPITAQTEDKTTGTCTVSVYDADKPQDKVTKSVSVTVNCLSICQYGQTRCNGDKLEQCASSSCAWQDLGVNNQCQKITPCSTDGQCQTGQVCKNNQCVADDRTKPPLNKCSQCGSGALNACDIDECHSLGCYVSDSDKGVTDIISNSACVQLISVGKQCDKSSTQSCSGGYCKKDYVERNALDKAFSITTKKAVYTCSTKPEGYCSSFAWASAFPFISSENSCTFGNSFLLAAILEIGLISLAYSKKLRISRKYKREIRIGLIIVPIAFLLYYTFIAFSIISMFKIIVWVIILAVIGFIFYKKFVK